MPTRLFHRRGFVALIAVLLVSFGTIGLSLSTLGAAALYADSVRAREVRIQTSLNKESCTDTARLYAERNIFLTGELRITEFGCTVLITRVGNEVSVDVLRIELNPKIEDKLN